MFKYRLAETRDLESLMRMSRDFYAVAKDSVEIPYDEDSVMLKMLHMIEDGLVVVVYPSDNESPDPDPEDEQQPIVGAVAGAYFQSDINMHIKCLKEHMFWLDPEYRNGMVARTLLLVFQIGAKADDVQYLYMSKLASSPEAVDHLYGSMGYSPAETAFIKEL